MSHRHPTSPAQHHRGGTNGNRVFDRWARITIALVAVVAAIGTIVVSPTGSVLACSISIPPSVDPVNLPTVLDPDGAWVNDVESRYGDFNVTGAARLEVTEVTPETDDLYSGSLSRTTNTWGDAAIEPITVVEPASKDSINSCDGNSYALGTSWYYLTTADADTMIPIAAEQPHDDQALNATLDDVFGPSTVVTEEMAVAATPGGPTSITSPESPPETSPVASSADSGPRVPVSLAAGGVILIAGAIALAGLLLRRSRP